MFIVRCILCDILGVFPIGSLVSQSFKHHDIVGLDWDSSLVLEGEGQAPEHFFFTLLNSKDNLWHHSRLSWHHSLLSVRLLTVGFRKPTGCLSFCVAMVTWIISLLSRTAVWDLIISQVWMRVLTGNSMPQQHGRFSLSLFAVFGTSNRNGPRDGWHVA